MACQPRPRTPSLSPSQHLSSSQQTLRRKQKVHLIEAHGSAVSPPCEYCVRMKNTCIIWEGGKSPSVKCSRCVDRGRPCVVVGGMGGDGEEVASEVEIESAGEIEIELEKEMMRMERRRLVKGGKEVVVKEEKDEWGEGGGGGGINRRTRLKEPTSFMWVSGDEGGDEGEDEEPVRPFNFRRSGRGLGIPRKEDNNGTGIRTSINNPNTSNNNEPIPISSGSTQSTSAQSEASQFFSQKQERELFGDGGISRPLPPLSSSEGESELEEAVWKFISERKRKRKRERERKNREREKERGNGGRGAGTIGIDIDTGNKELTTTTTTAGRASDVNKSIPKSGRSKFETSFAPIEIHSTSSEDEGEVKGPKKVRPIPTNSNSKKAREIRKIAKTQLQGNTNESNIIIISSSSESEDEAEAEPGDKPKDPLPRRPLIPHFNSISNFNGININWEKIISDIARDLASTAPIPSSGTSNDLDTTTPTPQLPVQIKRSRSIIPNSDSDLDSDLDTDSEPRKLKSLKIGLKNQWLRQKAKRSKQSKTKTNSKEILDQSNKEVRKEFKEEEKSKETNPDPVSRDSTSTSPSKSKSKSNEVTNPALPLPKPTSKRPRKPTTHIPTCTPTHLSYHALTKEVLRMRKRQRKLEARAKELEAKMIEKE
ncbi:hypothetical protein DFH27DRAFT_524591 [Peziza echinospora]|nr:hypothetical protein DFH27DRAFT_524591 [Peziza echinospora]